MRCLPDLTHPDDTPYWVTRDAFCKHFDQADFLCRQVENVTPSYLAEWFHTPADGIRRFILPTVQFIAGKTQFISGRHRTAVLLQYLEDLPIAFPVINRPPQNFLIRLALRSLEFHELIDLPDLPIVKHIP